MSIDWDAGTTQILASDYTVFWRQRLGIRESGQAETSARFLLLGLEGVSAGGNPGGHWETRDALTSTQLSFMAGRGRNCDYGPAEVDADSDIRRTLNVYGDVVTDWRKPIRRVVRLAIPTPS
jgi:hypothetical protein